MRHLTDSSLLAICALVGALLGFASAALGITFVPGLAQALP
jgi:hypothetical protein